MKTSTLPAIMVTVDVMSRLRDARSLEALQVRIHREEVEYAVGVIDAMACEEQDRDVLLGHLQLYPLESIQDVCFGSLCIGENPCFHAAVQLPLLFGPGRAEVQGILGGKPETQFSILILAYPHGQDIELGLDLELSLAAAAPFQRSRTVAGSLTPRRFSARMKPRSPGTGSRPGARRSPSPTLARPRQRPACHPREL